MVCDVCFEHFLIVIYNVHILVTFFCCSFTKMSAEKIVSRMVDSNEHKSCHKLDCFH